MRIVIVALLLAVVAVDDPIDLSRHGEDVSGHYGSNENSSRSVRGLAINVCTMRTPPTLE